jgi:hypothetical protein
VYQLGASHKAFSRAPEQRYHSADRLSEDARHLCERLLPLLRRNHGEHIAVDLVTCHAGLPTGFPPEPETAVFYTGNYRGRAGPGAVRTLTRLALFPFTLLYLLLCAAAAHLRRACRRVLRSTAP